MLAKAALAERLKADDPHSRADKCKALARKLTAAVCMADGNFYECDKYVHPSAATTE